MLLFFFNAVFLWSPCYHILLVFFLSFLLLSFSRHLLLCPALKQYLGVFPSFVFFSLYTYLKWSDSFLLLMPHKAIIPSSVSILRHALIYPTVFLISLLGYPSGTSRIVYSKWTNHFSPNEWLELILQYPQFSEWHHHTFVFKPTT